MRGIGHSFLKCSGSCCCPGIAAALLNRWAKGPLLWAAERCNHTADFQHLTSTAELNPEVSGSWETSQHQRQELDSVIRRGYWVKVAMLRPTGSKILHRSKQDFSSSSFASSWPGFTEGSWAWKTFLSPLNTLLEAPTAQGSALSKRKKRGTTGCRGRHVLFQLCKCCCQTCSPWEFNHPTHLFF